MGVYDLCIVGAGMIGSAAARHASSNKGLVVCLVGPEEPVTRKILTGNEVFGAYFDEGRITRETDSREVWALLAQRSIRRYRELERASGVDFYQENGEIVVGAKNGSYISKITENAKRTGLLPSLHLHDYGSLRAHFPALYFAEQDVGIQNTKNSGIINPRKMVSAQIRVAQQQGCDLIRDVVVHITKCSNDTYRLRTENNTNIEAKRVLLATSVFTTQYDLLGGSRPIFTPMPQTVTLAEVSYEDAQKLYNLPTVLYTGYGRRTWPDSYPRNPDGNIHFYMLPPIRYPDGKYYMKLGHSDAIIKKLLKETEIPAWYCGGGDGDLEIHMFQLLKGILPDISFISHHGDASVTMVTPTLHPYIDLISPTFGVALGGNGWAAKSSDEIGRVAANMVINSNWTYDLPWEIFKLKMQHKKDLKKPKL